MKPFRFENVPKTYRFKSSYSREEPPGTYQKQLPHNKQIIKEKEKNVPSDSIGMVSTDLDILLVIVSIISWCTNIDFQKVTDKTHRAML